MRNGSSRIGAATIIALLAVAAPRPARAHCDTMDGPVVKSAQAALGAGNVTPILKWVRPEHEPEIRQAFARALRVRAGGGEAGELADRWFLETLVRLHRAGEGAPFTGLRPAGAGAEPAIAAADEALQKGSGDALIRMASEHVAAGVRDRLERALAARREADSSVEAGRRYVAAYVELMHYLEGVLKSGSHSDE